MHIISLGIGDGQKLNYRGTCGADLAYVSKPCKSTHPYEFVISFLKFLQLLIHKHVKSFLASDNTFLINFLGNSWRQVSR